jgi:hypothetical protein
VVLLAAGMDSESRVSVLAPGLASSAKSIQLARVTLLLWCSITGIGCPDHGGVQTWATNEIGNHIEPRNELLKRRLNTCSNVAGQGVLVFVRSTSDCGPQYLWVADGELGAYAVDSESQIITPDLPMLERAPSDTREKIGFTAATPAVRKAVCSTNDH